jgi:hypothetical protein
MITREAGCRFAARNRSGWKIGVAFLRERQKAPDRALHFGHGANNGSRPFCGIWEFCHQRPNYYWLRLDLTTAFSE